MTMIEAGPIKPGRPRKDSTTGRRYFEGKLYPLLVAKLPKFLDKRGQLDVKALSRATTVSRQWLYYCMTNDTVSPRVAGLLIKADGKLTAKDLAPFVISF